MLDRFQRLAAKQDIHTVFLKQTGLPRDPPVELLPPPPYPPLLLPLETVCCAVLCETVIAFQLGACECQKLMTAVTLIISKAPQAENASPEVMLWPLPMPNYGQGRPACGPPCLHSFTLLLRSTVGLPRSPQFIATLP